MAQQNPVTGSLGAVASADAAGVHVTGLNKSFGANHVPVSYTHLTLPTTPYV